MLYSLAQHMVYVVFKCVFRWRGGTAITFLVEARAMHRPPMRFLASGQLGTDKQRASFFGRFPPKTVSVIGKCLFCFSDDDTAYTHNFASHPFASFLVFMLSQPKKHVFYVFVVLQLFLWGPNMLHSSIRVQYTTLVIARAEYQSERERRRRRRGDNLSAPPPPPSVPRKKETLCRE